ncbi:gliding motility protein GldD [Flavobacterium akiainvivens]|uniref:Gliding motility protein GldD n=1 Tax=Flavobacterium akiainvivens TaxID=1202724 RepID=A0A0M8M9Y8_9FLAO|nr:gliding motility lipoprotein GldD [Flavobacterium akiainvivens]KOS06663.1 gliding motility protein GldD [Flavobacterium akiainvivens]SFQ70608.1 protein involved in gliding motility GldD [Flavobacterium akiainvivens]
MKLFNNPYIICLLALACLMFNSCGDDPTPKPNALLRLDYPLGTYKPFEGNCPYTFGINSLSKIKKNTDCNLEIYYPKMKATLYITYKPVQGNLETLLRDAEKLTYEHVIKATDIVSYPFINDEDKVYGMFSQVGGDAATNAQFYVTDSLHHFVTGSMYFYTKPNFDSIMPAASYLKDDMRFIMETLKWR